MFLSAVLFVLFVAGCWLYCLADAALTPAAEFRGLRKSVWITVIAVTFILGAAAWVVARKPWRARRRPPAPPARPGPAEFDVPHVRWDPPQPAVDEFLAAEALTRHPAFRAAGRPERTGPIGPDDDPEFLRMLDRLIRGTPDAGELPAVHLYDHQLLRERQLTRPDRHHDGVGQVSPDDRSGPLAQPS